MDLSSQTANARRKVLYAAICATCHEAGFGNAEKAVLETLLEMLQSLLLEIGRNGRAFCELSGRTEPIFADATVALIDVGINLEEVMAFAKRPHRVLIPIPQQMPRQPAPKILQAGEKKPLSTYIPDHYIPFPDPHAYIRTPTHKQPVTEYEAIREKSASQKRDVEKALTKFMAKTCEPHSSHTLFPDEQMCHLYPLITLKTSSNPYLEALLPQDQVFEDDVSSGHNSADGSGNREQRSDGQMTSGKEGANKQKD